MASVWNFLQWRLVLGDTALSPFYAVLRKWVSIILWSGTLLIKSSMECLFCIWLTINNKDWTLSAANCNLNDTSKQTCNLPSSLSSLKQTIKPVSNAKLTRPVGFINKGNMCYANSILQVLTVVLTSEPPQKHFITYVTSYQPQHGWENKLNQNCWPIQPFMGLKT